MLDVADKLYKAGKYKECLNYYEEIILKSESSDKEIYPKMAIAYRLIGDFERAENIIHKGLEKFPEYMWLYIELAALRNNQKRWRDAIELWGKIMESSQNISDLNIKRIEKSFLEFFLEGEIVTKEIRYIHRIFKIRKLKNILDGSYKNKYLYQSWFYLDSILFLSFDILGYDFIMEINFKESSGNVECFAYVKNKPFALKNHKKNIILNDGEVNQFNKSLIFDVNSYFDIENISKLIDSYFIYFTASRLEASVELSDKKDNVDYFLSWLDHSFKNLSKESLGKYLIQCDGDVRYSTLYSFIMEEFNNFPSNKEKIDLLFEFLCMSDAYIRRNNLNHYGDLIKNIKNILISELNNYSKRFGVALKTSVKKIVFINGVLKHGRTLNHARLILGRAILLAKNTDAIVNIIVSNEIPFINFYGKSIRAYEFSSKKYLEILYKFFQENIPVELKDRIIFEAFPLLDKKDAFFKCQKLTAVIDRVFEINPDVVIHSGSPDWNESYFIRRGLWNFFPTVYTFTQRTNAVDKFNDIYLPASDYPLNGPHEKNKVVVAPIFTRSAEIGLGKESYCLLDIKNHVDELKIVSVYGAGRMDLVFRGYQEKEFLKIFELLELPNVTWSFIGLSDAKTLLDAHPLFANYINIGKVKIINFEENLACYLSHCDLFLHLKGFVGGGWGGALATRLALPVLSFDHSDAAQGLPEECVFNNESDFFSFASRLLSDNSLRKKYGELCQEKYYTNIGNDGYRIFMQGLEKAISNFNLRKI